MFQPYSTIQEAETAQCKIRIEEKKNYFLPQPVLLLRSFLFPNMDSSLSSAGPKYLNSF